MMTFLRVIGLLNAAVWFGGAVAFTVALAPAVFQPALKQVFHDYHLGLVAQALQTRYLHFHLICGAIALLLALGEWFVFREARRRTAPGLVAVLCGISLAGAFGLLPLMKDRFEAKYTAPTAEARAAAAASFRKWHGVSQGVNLAVLGGLAFYLWRMASGSAEPRIGSRIRFGGLTIA